MGTLPPPERASPGTPREESCSSQAVPLQEPRQGLLWKPSVPFPLLQPPCHIRCCKQSLEKKKSQILDNRAGCQTRGTGHWATGIQAVPCLPAWGWTHFQDKKALRGMETRIFKTRNQQPARAYLVPPERRSRERGTLANQPRAAGGCF